jgi:hypothetical protein
MTDTTDPAALAARVRELETKRANDQLDAALTGTFGDRAGLVRAALHGRDQIHIEGDDVRVRIGAGGAALPLRDAVRELARSSDFRGWVTEPTRRTRDLVTDAATAAERWGY